MLFSLVNIKNKYIFVHINLKIKNYAIDKFRKNNE